MRTQLKRNRAWARWISTPTLVGLAVAELCAADWPQYRGPNHDGISADPIRTNWNAVPPQQIWKVPLEAALSSFSISNGKAFTQTQRLVNGQDQEFCLALDANTGAELWATPLGIADYPDGGVGDGDGPRSTPSVDGNRVFVLSSYLQLACLDAMTGQPVWVKDLTTEYGGVVIPWQNAASPLIEGGLVLVNGNGRPNESLLAFHKEDGSLAWKGQSDGLTHASPVAATIGGVRQAVFFAQSGLVSVAPDTGAVLWRLPLKYNEVSVAASPVVVDDLVYCSRAYAGLPSLPQAGAVVVKVTPSGSGFAANPTWSKVNQLMNHWSTPVHLNGCLYGMYGQGSLQFKCVELATGTEKWSVGGFGYGGVLGVDGKVLASSENGWLVLVDPNPNAYTELARFHALDGKTWNVPAVSNGRIYVRSSTGAICLDVAGKARPRLKLTPALVRDQGIFRMLIAPEDGSPLDAGRVAGINVLVADILTNGAATWTRIMDGTIFENGQLRWEDSPITSRPQRFFRVEEQP